MPSVDELEYLEGLAHPEKRARRQMIWRSIIAFVVSGTLILALRLAFKSQEVNTWVCRDNEWVQVGQPLEPMPRKQCGIPRAERSYNPSLPVGSVPANAVAFEQRGNLISGLPDLEPGKLYLAYDPYGVRVEKIALVFDYRSVCAIGPEVISCFDPRIDSGLKVRITGHSTGDFLLVQSLETMDADE